VVLTYCNEDEAAACLASLSRSTYDALTVLLVDNASPDGSGARLHARFPDVEYLPAAVNGGYTAGNNRGMEWALARDSEYVLLLNDDTDVDGECVTRLVSAAEESGAAAAVPQITYFDEPHVVWYAGGSYSRARVMCTHYRENQSVDPSTERREITFVCGCCLLIRADVLRALGGFDESYFTYAEDLELSVRLHRAGYRMVYEPTARVLHRIGRSAESTARQIVLRDKNRRRLVARHYRGLERVVFWLWFYPTRAIHFARYVVRRDWARVRAILTGAFGSIADTAGPVRLE
jgi:GT2 family glycosyltransferase